MTIDSLYQRCPECSHKRAADDPGPAGVCPRCGLVFAKWMKRRFAVPAPAVTRRVGSASLRRRLRALVLSVPDTVSTGLLAVRAVLYLLFLVWGLRFIWMEMSDNTIGASFMHNIDLVFHEAGHVLFRPFGDFMTVLGGSLMQVLMPMIATVVLLWKNRDAFGASFGLWWTAQSLMDIAPYIDDARAGRLMLLGGVTGSEAPHYHDWHNILERLGLLESDHAIATVTDICGEGLMLLALGWGGLILSLQYRRRAR